MNNYSQQQLKPSVFPFPSNLLYNQPRPLLALREPHNHKEQPLTPATDVVISNVVV